MSNVKILLLVFNQIDKNEPNTKLLSENKFCFKMQ